MLAATALSLGLLAMIVGDPRRARTGPVDVAGLARSVGPQSDRISAIELARMIRDRAPGLRIIDLRSPEEFGEYRIPGAERMSLTAFAAARFDGGQTLVLYADDSANAVQGWELLRARGHARVHVLGGGIVAWVDEVMDAHIPADASESERAAFRETADLSRYFGGQPTISDLPRSRLDAIALPVSRDSPAKSPKEAARRLERRGC
jgi:rhodanese-related sulfurtransferase